MAAPITLDTYKEVILFLAIAGVVVPLFHRLRVSPVLGFLGAGALLGPYGLGRLADDVPILRWVTIASREEMTHLAEFGVVFLLFVMGLELSWVRLRRLRRLIFGLGTLQILACSAALAAIALQLGFDHIQAIVAGLALALSSTAIVLPVLAEGKRLNTPTGRTSFAVLLAQDLAVAPILFTVALFGSAQAGADTAAAFFTVLFKALLALVLIVGAGRVLLRPLFRFVAATRSPELFVAASLLVVITASVGAAASGLSMGLGAFVAGLLLAETEYRRAVEATDRSVQGPAARRLLRLRRHGIGSRLAGHQSRLDRRLRRGADRPQGGHHLRPRLPLPDRPARRGGERPAARARRRVRLRDDRRGGRRRPPALFRRPAAPRRRHRHHADDPASGAGRRAGGPAPPAKKIRCPTRRTAAALGKGPRRHRRLRPGRAARRRHARPSRHSVHRRRRRRQSRRRPAQGRQAGLLRRRHVGGVPARLRARRRPRPRLDP